MYNFEMAKVSKNRKIWNPLKSEDMLGSFLNKNRAEVMKNLFSLYQLSYFLFFEKEDFNEIEFVSSFFVVLEILRA